MSLSLAGDGTIAGFDAAASGFGGLVAVYYAEKTDTFTASVASGASAAVTGLSLSDIAVADSTNRLIITAWFGAAGNSADRGRVGIAINDGSGLLSVGATANTRTSVSAGGITAGTDPSGDITMNPSITIVHTPGSTSAKTYTVHAINVTSGTNTLYVNRTEADGDSEFIVRAASALLIQEVSV